MQIGLKPDEVLDMSFDMLQACIQGYSDHMFDMQLLGIQQGYWAGYYSNSKKPKPLKYILDKMARAHNKQGAEILDVDVDAFLQMERDFKQKLKQRSGNIGG